MFDIKEDINSFDWTIFDGPSLYDAGEIPSALIDLSELVNPEQAHEVGDRLINAIGNNHSGVYYPVVLKALDYIITIGEKAKNKACRTCAFVILNDLFYFEPHIGDFKGCSKEELKKIVKDKLKPYSEENIERIIGKSPQDYS